MNWILAHFAGDFLLQNDWMAENKKSSSFACLVHVFFYIIPFMFLGLSAVQLSLIAVQHFIQDRTRFVVWYCNLLGKFRKKENSAIGYMIVDNIFHLLWINFVILYVD